MDKPSPIDMQKLATTTNLNEEEFNALCVGGLFQTILDHPKIGVFRELSESIIVHISGYGVVQIAKKDIGMRA